MNVKGTIGRLVLACLSASTFALDLSLALTQYGHTAWRVRDDGKGIDPRVLAGDGQPGHYGLPCMHERAKLFGGKLDVWSEHDSGTEVELTIPGSLAYAESPGKRRFMSWRTGA
jgi:nitrate/nitrite-specific signal transduction histidine kinase